MTFSSSTQRLVSSLKETSLFSELSDLDLLAVLRFSNPRHLAPRQTLFWQGDPSGCFFLVLSGTVKLTRRDAKSREQVLGLVNSGQFIGEHTLFSGNGYPATALAVTETEVLAVQSVAFVRFVQQRNDLAWRMLTRLSKTIDTLIAHVEHLSTHQAEERVAQYLLDRFDAARPAAALADIPARRSDLAGLLSLSKETLCRVLSKFRRAGWIEADGQRIVLHSPEQLEVLVAGAPGGHSISAAGQLQAG